MNPANRANAFTLMAGAISKTPHLSGGCREVFVALCRHANAELKCWPSQTTLAKELGSTRQRIGRMYRELQALGHIYTDGTTTPGGVTVWTINAESLGLAKAPPFLPAPAASAAQSQPVETAKAPQPQPVEAVEVAEAKAVPVPTPAQAPRQDSTAQALARMLEAQTRVLETLGVLTGQVETLAGRVDAMERTPARMAESQVAPVEAPKPVAPVTQEVVPAPKNAEDKTEKPEQLFLLPEGDNTSDPAPEPKAEPAQKTEPKPAWDEEDGWRRFWAAYPNHKEEDEARRNFHTRFARLAQPEAMLQRMLGVIGQMRRTDLWTKEDGKYIHLAKNFLGRNKKFETLEAGLKKGDYEMVADDEDEAAVYDPSRPQYLQRSPASDAELVTGMETGRSAYAPAAPKPVRQWSPKDWGLCSERCKNYDPEKGCCRCGVKVPPEKDGTHVGGGYPPDECPHFERIEGEEPPPRTLDELMNESLRPALRTGVRGVRSLASVFSGIPSSMEGQT